MIRQNLNHLKIIQKNILNENQKNFQKVRFGAGDVNYFKPLSTKLFVEIIGDFKRLQMVYESVEDKELSSKIAL